MSCCADFKSAPSRCIADLMRDWMDSRTLGSSALSAAALTVAKLMTIRVEKGSKDKLQALLLIDEMSDEEA